MSKNTNQTSKTKKELKAKLEELEASAAAEPKVIPMDEVDRLRLENLLLRERLVARETNDAQNIFRNQIIEKYGVDVETETVAVDPQTGTITISLKE